MDQSPRLALLVFLLLFIFLSPDPSSIRRLSSSDLERLEDYKKRDFDVIANATYGSYDGLNLTGFRHEDGYQWHLLPIARTIAKTQQSRWMGQGPVYERLHGEVIGEFVQRQIFKDEQRKMNFTTLLGEESWIRTFQRNVTEAKGELSLLLEDSRPVKNAKEIRATLSIYTDNSPGNGWQANLQGVHFPNGSVILSTASRKFNALPALPQFAMNEQQFVTSRQVMNSTVSRLWDQMAKAELPPPSLPSCELVMWLQQRSLAGTESYVRQIEDELEHPNGAPIRSMPPMLFSAVVLSPDCGYVLEADILHGPKKEVYWGLVQRLLTALVITIALQISLLKRQMERCATPSTRSRISYYSIGIAALGDGLMLFGLIAVLTVEANAFLLVSAAAFLCIMHVAFFEVKFIFDIWTVQVGDPAEAERARQRRAAPNQSELPLPVTARVDGATPVPIPLQDEAPRATFASLYSRFYFGLVNLMFLTLWAMSWTRSLRSAYFNLLALLYFSMWLPQIYRNVMRNCRKALNWEYVIGSSILRALPVVYWYLDDHNILWAHTDPSTAFFLLGWLWTQVMVLLSQQYLGPRLLVKESWCPAAYDYHPVLFDDLEAGGLPIGALASASEGKDKDNKTRKVFDCAICMNEIDVPVISKNENTGRGWLEQSAYMVTPCRHIFHTECLEGWMNLRLVCPVCREALPPL